MSYTAGQCVRYRKRFSMEFVWLKSYFRLPIYIVHRPKGPPEMTDFSTVLYDPTAIPLKLGQI